MKTETIITITKGEEMVFNYLNRLRDSGVTNMFGATPYIIDEFGLDKKEASEILTNWMQNFNEDGYSHLVK